MAVQLTQDVRQIVVHLDGIGDGRDGLHFYVVHSTIPHQLILPNKVRKTRGIANSE